MTEQQPIDPPPSTVPRAKRMSTRRRVLIIALSAAVAVGTAIGTTAILHAINDRPADVAKPPPGDLPTEGETLLWNFPEHRFAVAFPSEPDRQSTTQQVREFSVPITAYSVNSGSDQFVVSAAEMPATVLEQQDLDTFLTNSLAGAASGVGAELTEQSFTTLGGERAIAGMFDVQNSTAYVTITVREGMQFSVMVLTDDSTTAEDFVSSFAFLTF